MSSVFGLLTASYVTSSVLFILSLGGLGRHETARRGNAYGIAGFVIAVLATLLWSGGAASAGALGALAAMIVIGTVVGGILAARVEMTAMPQLVAILHTSTRAIGQLPEERELFERLISEGGLVDVGRMLHPDDDTYFSWWAPWRNMKARNIGWRLDYVLASHTLGSRASSCRVLREFGTSDHGPVIAEFAPPN